MPLTLTPPVPANVYSDGNTSNRIMVTVKDTSGALLTGKILTGTIAPSGTATVQGKTDLSGIATVLVATAASGQMTLTLTDAGSGDKGTCTLSSTPFTFNGFTYSTPQLSAPATITITAALLAAGQTTPADKIPLDWVPAMASAPAYLPSQKVTTDKTKPATFTYVSQAITQGDITALNSSPIEMNLQIGGDSSYFFPAQIATGLPLDAPTLALPPELGTTINDEIMKVCATTGIPFRIPRIANVSPQDFVTLMASQTATGPGIAVLATTDSLDIESGTADSVPFAMDAMTTNTAFDVNGSIYVYYSVLRLIDGTMGYSERLPLKVQLSHVPGPPDGEPDMDLTPPTTDITVYSLDNLGQSDPMNVTVDFKGDIVPAAGDTITPVIYMKGYTAANLNSVKRLTLPAYTITSGDLVPGPFTKKFTFTSDQFADIDGSNGQAYYLYTSGTSPAVRSPSRTIIVDTVAPYSGSIAKLSRAFA